MPGTATSLVARLSADSPDVSMPYLRQQLGEFLGLPEPAPEEVVRRALADPGFEADLVISRGAPGFLRALFDQPGTRAYAAPPGSALAESAPPESAPDGHLVVDPASSAELIGKAAGAVMRWGRSGFARVDLEVLQRREDACLACPHLTDPRAAVQKLAPAREVSDLVGARTGKKVCELCGCQVSRKMRMTTESCPGSHPAQAGLTRWGEPVGGGLAQTEGG